MYDVGAPYMYLYTLHSQVGLLQIKKLEINIKQKIVLEDIRMKIK